MARKILLKENGLDTTPPPGYHYIGYSGLTFSEKSSYLTTPIGYNPFVLKVLSITSSDILQMGTNPILLLDSPGSNKYYDIDRIILEYKDNGILYNIASSISVSRYGSATSDLMNEGGDNFVIIKVLNDSLGSAINNYINQAVYLSTDDNANPTMGNGIIIVKLFYRIITFGI